MYHIFFTHSSVGEHLVCFRSLVIINSPAVNTEMCTSFQINVFVFSGYMPRSGIAGSYDSSVFTFLRNLHTVLYSGCTSLHSHQQWPRVPISPQPCHHLLFLLFDDGRPDKEWGAVSLWLSMVFISLNQFQDSWRAAGRFCCIDMICLMGTLLFCLIL